MTKQASSNRSAKKRSKWRSGEPGPDGAGRDTRVDPAHVVVREESVPESSVAVEVPETTDESPDREEWERSLQRQADQLADYLRQRRRELDLRESKLNAELALLENDSRRARLWLAGREAELDEMREALQKQGETIEAEARRLATEAAKPAPQHVERERNLNTRQAELEAREVRVRAWESEIAASNEEIKTLRAELEEDLRAGGKTLADQRTAFDEQCAAVLEELAEARCRAEEKSRKADQARAALEAVRAEVQAMQRDALQDRIAAEELRIAVAETAPPATLVETLAALEAKLDRRYADRRSRPGEEGHRTRRNPRGTGRTPRTGLPREAPLRGLRQRTAPRPGRTDVPAWPPENANSTNAAAIWPKRPATGAPNGLSTAKRSAV